MKKIKMAFMVFATLIGTAGAFASTNRHTDDHYQTISGVFTDLEAGGHHWTCTGASPTCTFHSDGSPYTAGVFHLIN